LKELFDALDSNNDGVVSAAEFHRGMTGKRKVELRKLLSAEGKSWKVVLAKIDMDHNGEISFTEFVKAVSTQHGSLPDDERIEIIFVTAAEMKIVTATMREVVHNVVRNSFPEGVGPIKRLALGDQLVEDGETFVDCGAEDGARLNLLFGDPLRELLLECERGRVVPAAGLVATVAEAASVGAWGSMIRMVEEGADLDSPAGGTGYGYNALMILAAAPGDVELDVGEATMAMQYLIQQGANVNAGDDGNKTALHVCGKHGGSMEQVLALLDGGADVNWAMNGGYTPLWYIRNYRRPMQQEAEAELVKRGAVQEPAALESRSRAYASS